MKVRKLSEKEFRKKLDFLLRWKNRPVAEWNKYISKANTKVLVGKYNDLTLLKFNLDIYKPEGWGYLKKLAHVFQQSILEKIELRIVRKMTKKSFSGMSFNKLIVSIPLEPLSLHPPSLNIHDYDKYVFYCYYCRREHKGFRNIPNIILEDMWRGVLNSVIGAVAEDEDKHIPLFMREELLYILIQLIFHSLSFGVKNSKWGEIGKFGIKMKFRAIAELVWTHVFTTVNFDYVEMFVKTSIEHLQSWLVSLFEEESGRGAIFEQGFISFFVKRDYLKNKRKEIMGVSK